VSRQLVTLLRDCNLLNYLVIPECRRYREKGRIEYGEWKDGMKTKEKEGPERLGKKIQNLDSMSYDSMAYGLA
jgi:hypothetical protein